MIYTYITIVSDIKKYLDEIYNTLTEGGYSFEVNDRILELEEEIKYQLEFYPRIVSDSFSEIIDMRENLCIYHIYDFEACIDELTCLIKEYACTSSFQDTYADEQFSDLWENTFGAVQQLNFDENLDDEFVYESKRRFSADIERANVIHNYICRCEEIITREKILVEFPNTSMRALNYALSEADILSYDAMYIAAENIHISHLAKRNMSLTLRKLTQDRQQHNIGELFDCAKRMNSDFLLDAKIETPHQLFSVISYFFANDYIFSRPYVAAKGVKILTADDQLKRYILHSENYSIRALLDYAKDRLIAIDNILRILNTLNDRYYILDKESIIPINETGITYVCMQNVIRVISDEIVSRGCVAIRDLTAFNTLPAINVKWTEWLVYSVLNRMQNPAITVLVSSSRFKDAIPLVAMIGEDTKENIQKATIMHDNTNVITSDIDDLDDLDSLLEDIIDIDFEL